MRTGRLSPSWSVISVRSIVLPEFVQGRQPAMGAGCVHQKGWLGHAVRIEGDSDRRGESLCSAARDRESSGGKDGGSFRVDLGEQAAGLPSGNAESFLSTCTRIARKNWMSV
jgi:hypothetical protein